MLLKTKEKIQVVRSHDYYTPFIAVILFCLVLAFMHLNLNILPETPSIEPFFESSASIFNSIHDIAHIEKVSL